MVQAYMSPQTTVQIRKKLAIGTLEDAPPFLASMETVWPQYAKPMRTVRTDAQRNHHRARDIRLGSTLLLVAGSISRMNGTLTRLKKYNRPSQLNPPKNATNETALEGYCVSRLGS